MASSWSTPSLACGVAWPAGEDVGVDKEDAVIVWDEARHLEHFVRKADFRTTSKSFGFLVPTPSRPVLAEASEEIFSGLSRLTETREVQESVWDSRSFHLSLVPVPYIEEDAPGAAPPLRVLDQTRVAGLDATVLAADDTEALAAWLGTHGFELREELKRWLGVYVAKKWNIVAFRYEKPAAPSPDDHPERLGSRAVRLTFSTDQPIYPYREPADAPIRPGRVLHLWVISAHPVEGYALPDGVSFYRDYTWFGRASFADEQTLPDRITTALAGVTFPSPAWVTAFSDRSEKRVAADVVFLKDSAAYRLTPATRIQRVHQDLYVPAEYLPFLAGGLGVLVWWLLRSRKRRSPLERPPSFRAAEVATTPSSRRDER